MPLHRIYSTRSRYETYHFYVGKPFSMTVLIAPCGRNFLKNPFGFYGITLKFWMCNPSVIPCNPNVIPPFISSLSHYRQCFRKENQYSCSYFHNRKIPEQKDCFSLEKSMITFWITVGLQVDFQWICNPKYQGWISISNHRFLQDNVIFFFTDFSVVKI